MGWRDQQGHKVWISYPYLMHLMPFLGYINGKFSISEPAAERADCRY
jgi:hypothetical protein